MIGLVLVVVGAVGAVVLSVHGSTGGRPTRHVTLGAHSPRVSASLTFHPGSGAVTDLRLTIRRAGRVVYSRPVTSRHACYRSWFGLRRPSLGCFLAPGPPGAKRTHVLVLDGSTQLRVVLDLVSGGASCCSVEQVFSWDPSTRTYVKTEHDFGYSPVQLESLNHNHRYEFVSGNGAFLCAFIQCAGSGIPIEIFTFDAGRFTNVTRGYPRLVTRDAAMWLKLFKQNHDGNGFIAGWSADEELLGNHKLVTSYLNQELRAGQLANAGGPSGQRFITLLMGFVRQHGYATASRQR